MNGNQQNRGVQAMRAFTLLLGLLAAPLTWALPPDYLGGLDALTIQEDQSGTLNMSFAFDDPDGANNNLTYAIIGGPTPAGIFTASTQGARGVVLNVQGVADQNGSGSIDLEVTDEALESVVISINVTVLPVNDAPVLVAPMGSLVVTEDQASIASIGLDSVFDDVDGETLTYNIDSVSQPNVIDATITGSALQFTAFPDAHGATDITVRARDVENEEVFDTISITVTPVPDAPRVDSPMGTVNALEDNTPAAIDLDAVFDDPDGQTLTYSVFSNDNTTLTNPVIAGSQLTLNLLADANGTAIVVVRATDPDTQFVDGAVTLDVSADNDAPVVTGAFADVNVLEDEAGIAPVDLTTAFTDVDGETLSYSITANTDPGVVSAAVSGTSLNLLAIADANGSTTLTVRGTDGAGLFDEATLTVNVAPQNDAPVVVAPMGTLSTPEDSSTVYVELEDVFDDIDGDTLTFSVEAVNPVGIINASISGDDFELTPLADQNGSVFVTVRAHDGSEFVEDTLTLNVTPENDAPVVTGSLAAVNVNEDEAGIPPVDLSAAFFDVDGETLIYSITADAAPGVINAAVSGSSVNLTAIADANGSTTLTVRGTDGAGLFDETTLTVNVAPQNDAPVVVAPMGTLSTPEDSSTVDVELEDVFDDIDGDTLTFSVEAVSPAGIINASISGDDLELTPLADQNGSVFVTVRAHDGSEFVEDTLTLNVTPENDAPVVTGSLAAVNVNEDEAGIPPVDLSAAFFDVDGETLIYSITADSAPGVINAAVSGSSVNLTAIANANGSTTLTVRGTDGAGLFDETTLTVNVAPQNDTPVLLTPLGTLTMLEDEGSRSLDLDLVFDDIDGDSLSYSVQSITPAGVVQANTLGNTLEITTEPDQNGSVTVVVRASDGSLFVDDALTVDVTPQNDAPVVAAGFSPLTLTEDQPSIPPIDLNTVFSDIDGDTLTFTIEAHFNPTVIDAAISGASLSLTARPDENGASGIRVRATDGDGQFVEDLLPVNVTSVADDPRVIIPMGTLNTDEDTPALRVTLNSVFTDPDGDSLSYTIESVTPPGITTPQLISGDLVLDLEPDANGTATVTVRATDGTGYIEDSVVLVVAPVNDGPRVLSASNAANHAEDEAGIHTVDATPWFFDPDIGNGDVLTYALQAGSGDAIITNLAVSPAGTITYELLPDKAGTFTAQIKVEDQLGVTASADLNIIVSAVNDPPVVANAMVPQVRLEDSGPIVYDISTVFDDADLADQGDALTLSVLSPLSTPLGPVSLSAFSLRLDPLVHASGVTTIIVQAEDNAGVTVQATVDFEFTPVNDPPVIGTGFSPLTLQEDAPAVNIDLTPVFDDPDLDWEGDNLTYAIISIDNPLLFDTVDFSSGPSTLTVDVASNQVGNSLIVVQVTDKEGQSRTADLYVSVALVQALAQHDAVTMDEGSGGTDPTDYIDIDVLANDVLGDPPTVVVAAGRTWVLAEGTVYEDRSESEPTVITNSAGIEEQVPNGSVELRPDGTVRYTPKDNFSGADFFHYTIEDGDGFRSTARVDITVNIANEAPIGVVEPIYTIEQSSFLDILAEGGLTANGFDADGDPITVLQVTTPDPAVTESFTFSADGAFSWTPVAGFTGQVTFDIQFFDGFLASEVVTVTIDVAPTPPPPPPPTSGEVEFDMRLSEVPLEDAVSTEANVLVVMDDSGSMDWDMMTDQSSGVWLISNSGVRANGVRNRGTWNYYIFDLPTNIYNTRPVLPVPESIAGDPDFAGNNYGLWRARSAQYSTIYYNPEIEYLPWRGLDRNNQDFENVDPENAPLDPYDAAVQTIDLTTPQSWTSIRVPVTRNRSSGRKNVFNNNVYLPHYYTTPVTGRPAWNDPNTRVDILDNGSTYAGGENRLDCAEDDGNPLTCTYDQEIQNFANWFTYYRTREYSAKAALGRSIADTTNLRMGYAVLNDSNDRERIDSLNSSFRSGHKAELLEQVYTTNSGGGTPLRRALHRAGRHFECASGDSFSSGSNTTPGNPACPILPAPVGQCQNNYTLLFSDGTWNGSSNSIPTSSLQNHDSDNGGGSLTNTAFDGGVFADTETGTLADIAMHFYERDLHPALGDGVPTTARDRNLAPAGSFIDDDELMHQHMKTYTVGFGVTGNIDMGDLPQNGVDADTGEPLIDFTQPFAWGDPFSNSAAKIDDMLHAALNGRGQFLQANNPVLLAAAFRDAFAEFADGSVSVSAVAFGSTRLRSGTVEYRGFFNLKFNSGDLQAVELLDDSGLPPADPIKWSAAEQLEDDDPNDRVIVTYDRVAQNGIPFRHASLNGDQQTMLSALEVNYLRGDRSLEEPAGPFRQREAILGDIVNSGPKAVHKPEGFRRDRAPYPLDSLYSSFVTANENRRRVVYVGANDGMLHAFEAGSGSTTPPLNNGTGRELFAYVPNKLIDSSQRFQNDLEGLSSLVYSHRYFVDLTPTIEDVFMARNGSGPMEWRSLLVGGLRGGGKGYFALDVTDPMSLSLSEANAAAAVQWEFTDEDDSYPTESDGTPLGGAVGAVTDLSGQPVKDLGYAYSEARLVMTNVNQGGAPVRKRWAAVFGNGYNSTAGIAKLFVLWVDEGQDGWQNGDFVKIDTGQGVINTDPLNPDPMAGIPNGLGQPTLIDRDLNGTADLAYAGDLQGHLYRFEMDNTNPSNWQAVRIFTATRDGTTATRQPITMAPFVQKHPTKEGFVVVFGSGSFITEDDGLSTEVQSVYGIWDRFEPTPATAEPAAKNTRLVEQTITNIVDETSSNPFQRIMSKNPVEYLPDAGGVAGTYGWYIDLDPPRPTTTIQGNPNLDTGGLAPPSAQYPGERAIRRIVQRDNVLVLASVIPRDANSCLRAPPGSVWFVDALTGGDPGRPVIDVNNDGVIDDNDFTIVNGEAFAAGFVLDGEGAVVDPSILLGDEDNDFLILNTSHETDPDIRGIIKDQPSKTGRLSWWELLDE